MRVIILLVIALSCPMAHADVYKCVVKTGKTVYQEKPCESAVKGQQMDIKADPVKEAEAKAKLEALQTEIDARRAERLQEEKDAAEQINQVRQVDALRRSAAAQQQQAVAAQRQAEALEKQNQQIYSPYGYWPGYSILPPSPGMRHDHESSRDGRKHERDREQDKSPNAPPGQPGR